MFYLRSRSIRRVSLLFMCVCLLLAGLWAYFRWWPAPAAAMPGWHLVFDDEFSETSLDTNKWRIEDTTSGGYQNCCLNYGVQYFTPEALSLTDGSLRITTKRESMGNYNYTSGAITTENKFSFLYGRVDIRAKLPKGQGLWPAFWLLPNNSVGIAPFEIDMMELLGNDPRNIYMTNNWGTRSTTKRFIGSDFSRQYHIFSIVWNAHSITWYIDNIQRFKTSQGVSNRGMYLIINSSIGGRWAGNPNAFTVLPQYMDIDYVRIYQQSSG